MDEKLEKLISKAEHLAEIERWSDAIPFLLKALAQNPQNFQANCLLSLCHYSLNELEKAIELAERAIAAAPEEEWGHRLRSIALSEIGRKKEALKSAEEAARLAPFEPFALQTLVNAYLSANKTRKAEEIAVKMRENFPEMEVTFFALGNVYLQKGDNYEAEKCFREALKLNPNSSDARNNLGVALLRQSQSEDTSLFKSSNLSILNSESEENFHEHFKEAIKLNPNHELAADNLKNQFSYFNVLYVFLVFLPFLSIAFFVAPGMTVVFSLFWFFGVIKVFWNTLKKRKNLSPELKMFLKSSSQKGLIYRFKEFTKFAAVIYKKTWKPHVLAIFAVIICHIEFGETIRGSSRTWNQGLAYILIVVSIIWVSVEMKKD
jgi:tetratricopeptide (TPR) repeat protein